MQLTQMRRATCFASDDMITQRMLVRRDRTLVRAIAAAVATTLSTFGVEALSTLQPLVKRFWYEVATSLPSLYWIR